MPTFEIPAGTTLTTLLNDVLPRLHTALVPEDRARTTPETWRASIAVDRGEHFAVEIRGNRLDVVPSEAPTADPSRAFWIAIHARTAEYFLADWMGERAYLPSFRPPGDLRWIGDPRVLRRLAMASGKVELAITDFRGERVTLTMAVGAAARKPVDPRGADVTVELSMATFEALLRGDLAPDAAIVDEHVTVKGKKLVAMQLALALSPFFPKGA